MRFHLARTDEPSLTDLAAIEAEWPEIQVDIDTLADPDAIDALVDQIYALDRPVSSELDRRRQRRSEARITRAAVDLSARLAGRKAVA